MKKTIQLATIILAATSTRAQTPTEPIVNFTATTENVAGAPDSIKIDLLRWSTDAERDQLVAAWTNPAAPGTGGRGGRGRGGAPPDPVVGVDDPSVTGLDDGNAGADAAGGRGAAADPAAAGGRGAGGRGGGRGGAAGGRGGARGGGAAAPEAPPPTPESSLTAALSKATTVGHLWSSEVAGYSVRLATRITRPDGSERILLITDRRLGAFNDRWKPMGSDPANGYEFSVIELRLNAKGEGEGKISLTGKVAIDTETKTIALENYAALPVILKNVKRK